MTTEEKTPGKPAKCRQVDGLQHGGPFNRCRLDSSRSGSSARIADPMLPAVRDSLPRIRFRRSCGRFPGRLRTVLDWRRLRRELVCVLPELGSRGMSLRSLHHTRRSRSSSRVLHRQCRRCGSVKSTHASPLPVKQM
ncbi:uncharacterized protein LOC119458611 [Dermacentor silvarum]|uniref:uncharacterized protein LOC119458611 n=1 Tax=Dermacentor silvarum TaxID=543639 RepID=UPI00210106ED|nr:uncharacterized protein LOC119458611 [Dermacentor silvarum]